MKLTTQKPQLPEINFIMLLSCFASFSVPFRKINIFVYKFCNVNVNQRTLLLIMFIYILTKGNYFTQAQITNVSGFTNYSLQYLIKINIVIQDHTKKSCKYMLNPILINELNTQFEYIFKSLQKKVKLI